MGKQIEEGWKIYKKDLYIRYTSNNHLIIVFTTIPVSFNIFSFVNSEKMHINVRLCLHKNIVFLFN